MQCMLNWILQLQAWPWEDIIYHKNQTDRLYRLTENDNFVFTEEDGMNDDWKCLSSEFDLTA